MFAPRFTRLGLLLAALGPGVIGLCADNDAGGMLSYLLTGANRALGWFLPALGLFALTTLFIQWLALRVARATGRPYSRLLIACVGRRLARTEAGALYALNTLVLVTEFIGMTLALSLAGVPRSVSLPLCFGLVAALTASRVYPRTERLLLRVAALSLAFVPALLFVHRAPGTLSAGFADPASPPWFLLLALAGNSVAPWMIYWQQNAVWAGTARTERQQVSDLATGVVAMVVMAGVVLVLGSVTAGNPAAWSSPLAWIVGRGGRLSGVLFAVGLFDAGLLAACTVSLSSLWTLREAFGAGARRPGEAPNRGRWRIVHLATLALAAAVVLRPDLASGAVALWAQAMSAVWMPVSLVLLGLVARSRRIMGRAAINPPTQVALGVVAAGFLVLAAVGLGI